MAIKITVAPLSKFRVKGAFADENGVDQKFDFGLLCKRLASEELRERTGGEVDLTEFMVNVTKDWFDVTGEDGKPLPFSDEALRQLLNLPGLAWLAYRTYLAETAAKEKN